MRHRCICTAFEFTMTGKNVGYIRISSSSQNGDRQLAGIPIDKLFTETFTGSVKQRPQLDACIEYLREGDTLHIHSIDRLARNLKDLQEIIDHLVKKDVSVVFHTENLKFTNTDNPMDKLMLHLMGAFAEFERTLSKSRQREGIDAAKKKGKHLGRPKLSPILYDAAKNLYESGLSVNKISKELQLSETSIYKLLKGVKKHQSIF